MKITSLCIHFPLLSTLLCSPCQGEESDPRDSQGGTVFFSLDNDVFVRSDDHYTNGLQIGWVSPYLERYEDGPTPGFLGRTMDALPLINEAGRQKFISYSLSHRLFTPQDITESELIRNDMPYSGLLFGTITAGSQNNHRMDAWSLSLGMVGPSAFGEEIQTEVHRTLSGDDPNGWRHQLRDEPLLNIHYEHRRRLTKFGKSGNWRGDVIAQAGASAGNMMTLGTAGIAVRYGWGLNDDYYIPPNFFSEETIGSRSWSQPTQDVSAYFFLLANGSVFANAIFWDGNTFDDSHSIAYDPYIARVYGGFRLIIDDFSLSAGLTWTTIPWDNPSNKKNQMYGRFGLSYSF